MRKLLECISVNALGIKETTTSIADPDDFLLGHEDFVGSQVTVGTTGHDLIKSIDHIQYEVHFDSPID